MTLLSTIITKAYRKSNIIPIGTVPTANEISEGLDILQQIVRSSIGVEAGGEFVDINVGGPYDESNLFPQWLPDNARLLLNISATTTFYLDPYPEDGQRLAIVDVLGTLGTYNLTFNGNGRNIEDTSTIVLSTSFMTSEWLYRADTGNWVKIQTLATTDQMPFPEEFDDYFVLSTNFQLASIHNQSVTPENVEILKRGRRNIRARYRNKKNVYPEYMGQLGERRNLLTENSNVFFRDFNG